MSQVLFWEGLKLPEGGCVGGVRKSEWDFSVDEQPGDLSLLAIKKRKLKNTKTEDMCCSKLQKLIKLVKSKLWFFQ
ncbi:hypothetical protein CapIbe_022831 [Capra ibex]